MKYWELYISLLCNLLFKEKYESYNSGFCRQCLFSQLVIGIFSVFSEVQFCTEPGTVSWMKIFTEGCVCVYFCEFLLYVYIYI